MHGAEGVHGGLIWKAGAAMPKMLYWARFTDYMCLAGATGWAGSELARSIAATSNIRLVAAVSRTHAGRRLGDVLGDARIDISAEVVFGMPINRTVCEMRS
jgi:hypothetical protein